MLASIVSVGPLFTVNTSDNKRRTLLYVFVRKPHTNILYDGVFEVNMYTSQIYVFAYASGFSPSTFISLCLNNMYLLHAHREQLRINSTTF